MKGPLLFLLAVAAAAGFGVAVLKPAIEEREELRADVRTAAVASAAVPDTLGEAERGLAGALGPSGPSGGWEEVGEVALEYARREVRAGEGGSLAFETEFARLASLLGALEPLAGSVAGVRVRALPETDLCRVVVEPAGGGR